MTDYLDELNTRYHCELRLTCEFSPVQIEGRLESGAYLYFRERSGEWTIGIGVDLEAAVQCAMGQYPTAIGESEYDGCAPVGVACEWIEPVLREHHTAWERDADEIARYYGWLDEGGAS